MAVATVHSPRALVSLLGSSAGTLGGLEPEDLCLDSRDVRPGDAFVALRGAISDGREYIDDALRAGAAVVIAEMGEEAWADHPQVIRVPQLRHKLPDLARQFYGDPSSVMTLLAVTGTNGKTSIVDFSVQLLRALGVPAGSIGTLGARLGEAVVTARNTTPDVLSLSRQLAAWRDEGVAHVALEASSHALEQQRLAGLKIHSAVFTNLTRDHFDYHGSESAYVEAKLQLFRDFPLCCAIYNADDVHAARVGDIASGRLLGISLESASAEVFVQVLSVDHALTFRMHTPWGTREISVGLSGVFNVFNVAAAIAAVVGIGFDFAGVAAAAETLRAVPGRMQRLHSGGDHHADIVIDYAHTPDALGSALQALRSGTSGLLWVVFGCGGDRDRGKRREMGEVAERYADRLVVTSDNPRNEDPAAIIDDICSGVSGPHERFVARAAAIDYVIQQARPGDTVLIAGKGHEDYQDVAGRRLHFSDAEYARHALLAGAGS